MMAFTKGNETYLTTQEVCEKLRVSRQTVNRLVKIGKLKQYKQPASPRYVYYKQSEVEAIQRIDSV